MIKSLIVFCPQKLVRRHGKKKGAVVAQYAGKLPQRSNITPYVLKQFNGCNHIKRFVCKAKILCPSFAHGIKPPCVAIAHCFWRSIHSAYPAKLCKKSEIYACSTPYVKNVQRPPPPNDSSQDALHHDSASSMPPIEGLKLVKLVDRSLFHINEFFARTQPCSRSLPKWFLCPEPMDFQIQ